MNEIEEKEKKKGRETERKIAWEIVLEETWPVSCFHQT